MVVFLVEVASSYFPPPIYTVFHTLAVLTFDELPHSHVVERVQLLGVDQRNKAAHVALDCLVGDSDTALLFAFPSGDGRADRGPTPQVG